MSSRADALLTSRSQRGFTLLEMLVVLAIIAALAVVVAPSIFQNVGDAKVNAARSQVHALALALDSYRLDNNTYPSTAQGLAALRTLPTAGDLPRNWRGPYLQRTVPLDPWNQQYEYLSPGKENAKTYDLFSLGRDGRIGGTGEDADITSWGGPVRP